VEGVSGTWKDLTDSVNFMAGNLTRPGAEHRGGHHAVANGESLQENHGQRQKAKSSN